MVVPASTSGPETHGRDTLDRYAQSCLGFVARDFGESAASADEEKRAVLAKAYARFFQQYRADLAYYFRTLYNVVKFVDEHGPTDKAMYMNLLRASLSDGELVLLFFNCLSPEGRGLKPLVEKHRLLKHLRRDKETVEALRDLYASRAYGEVS